MDLIALKEIKDSHIAEIEKMFTQIEHEQQRMENWASIHDSVVTGKINNDSLLFREMTNSLGEGFLMKLVRGMAQHVVREAESNIEAKYYDLQMKVKPKN